MNIFWNSVAGILVQKRNFATGKKEGEEEDDKL